MSELRHDIVQRNWVIIAPDRGKRPTDFKIEKVEEGNGFCPFCPGNESSTPAEIFSIREDAEDEESPWKVRVVSNKFPALGIDGDLSRRGVGLHDMMSGIGAHEVFIETPEHVSSIADRPVEDIDLLLQAYMHRLQDLMKDARFKYMLIFKNYGVVAGASLPHPHTQLIATPVTPNEIAVELSSAKDFFHLKERCIFCDIIEQEVERYERIVSADEDFIVMCPFASRVPFELAIYPRKHHHDFASLTEYMRKQLARTLKNVLARLSKALDDPPYNYVLHTSPNTQHLNRRSHYWETISADYHWHIEIIPRLTKIAGFEWGSGFHINPTPPEVAAQVLREVELPD